MTNPTYMDTNMMFINNIDDIPVIDVIAYSDDMKFDALMFKKYGGGSINVNGIDDTLQYIPLVLLFNNIPDITQLRIGTHIKFPDIQSLLTNISILDIEDSCPGILTTQQNSVKATTATGNLTTAAPKLNITLPSVNINTDTGVITF